MNRITPYTLPILALGAVAMAHADRDTESPVAHMYASNRTVAEIEAIIADGFRMHDIEVSSVDPYRLSGSFVKNTGDYAKTWWWTANRTGTDFTNFHSSRGARCLDIERTVTPAGVRYSGTFIRNAGADARPWWIFENLTMAQAQSLANTRNARLTDVDMMGTVSGVRRYVGIMIGNAAPNNRTWGAFDGLTSTQVTQLLSGNRRFTDIENVGPDRYSGIWEGRNGRLSWLRFGRTWEQLQFDARQRKARVIDIERTLVSGQSRFDYILMNNANPIETQVGEYVRNSTNGTVGFYLKRLNGPVIAQLMESEPFYPASTIKVLEHAWASYRVGRFNLPVNTPVRNYNDHTSDTHPANGSTVAFTLPLSTVARRMMINSDNQATNAIQDFAGNANGVAGRTAINTFKASVLGLNADVHLWHKFGAGGPANNPANRGTAEQMAEIYRLAMSTDLLGANGRIFFLGNMLNHTNNSGLMTAVNQVVNQEAASLGMSNAQRDQFRAQIAAAWKAGNWAGSQWVSNAGWLRLPYRMPNGTVSSRTYVMCAYIDNATTNNVSSISIEVLGELLRGEIRMALDSF